MKSRTWQTVTFQTAAQYKNVMKKALKPLSDMSPCEKINLRSNIAYSATPDYSRLMLIDRGSAHYK